MDRSHTQHTQWAYTCVQPGSKASTASMMALQQALQNINEMIPQLLPHLQQYFFLLRLRPCCKVANAAI